jgi:predicted TPR repeat methyltransferase
MERQFPLPTAGELTAYYDQAYADGMYRTFVDATEMKRHTAAKRFEAVRGACDPARWLDVGCADGMFLDALRTNGIEGTGIDLSRVAVERARERGLQAECATVDEHLPAEPYTTITAFDVVEHVTDPGGFLAGVERLLAPGGTLVLSTPNLRSVSHALMGRRWYFYIPEEHLYYFSPRSLCRLVERCGFEVVSCRSSGKPMTFDYALAQFREYNPLIYQLGRAVGVVLPQRLRQASVPLPIGEMLVIARKR